MHTLPAAIMALLEPFRPLFQESTWNKVQKVRKDVDHIWEGYFAKISTLGPTLRDTFDPAGAATKKPSSPAAGSGARDEHGL